MTILVAQTGHVPARIKLATGAVLGLELEKFPDLAIGRIREQLKCVSRSKYSLFEISLVLPELADFAEKHANLRRQGTAELFQVLPRHH